nr:ORF1 [Torque teno felis virus]
MWRRPRKYRRYHGRFRRRRFRRWPKRRRRWHKRYRRTVRTINVTENIPSRRRNVWVTGWEPLGNICATSSAKQEATPYAQLETGQPGQFQGTWGKHYFTPHNLLLRAQARWNYWSEDWSSYDYVRFVGATVTIIPPQDQSWMINFDPYFQYKKSDLIQDKSKEDLWDHPGILLHTPHTHIIMPTQYTNRNKFYKIRIRPPPGWKGYQRFPEAFTFILFHWLWTWFNPFKCFFDPQKQTSSCEAAPWWVANGQYDKWVDRSKYEAIGQPNAKDWGPFLPSKLGAQGIELSAYFLYKIKFNLAGDCIWRPLPRNFIQDGMVPPPNGPSKSRSAKDSAKRPRDEADIWPDDLDSDGLLTERAYNRITGHHQRNKRRRLRPQQRLEHLADKLRNILADKRLLSE